VKKRLNIDLLSILLCLLSFSIAFSINVEAMSSAPVETEAGGGLIAHFTFDGNLEDKTNNFVEGKVTGDRIDNSGGSITYDDGIKGQAAVFDGQSGLRLADGLIRDNSYSVSIWLNPKEITDYTTTFFGAVPADDASSQWISLVPQGPAGRTMIWSGENWYDAATNLTIPTEQWTHVAFTVDNGKMKVYLNGQEQFAGKDFPDLFTNKEAVFALGVNYWDKPFEGMIDDLRIYDEAISADKIAKLAEGAAELEVPDEVIVPIDPNSVSVHDPMIIEEDGTYYIFGSHLGAAKSEDLISWTAIGNGFTPDNPIIPNPTKELKEALEWPDPEDAVSTWAKSPIKLNGKYYLYFSSSAWGATRSAIGLAVADDIEGPYKYDRMIIKSYNEGEINVEGVSHDPNIHPNAIDPHVFFDAEGKLWMLYGSYAGGIFMLEMDPETGYPKSDNTYGKRITGGNHNPMEGSYILYNPKTEYYYLFLSFGTLAPDGGYNIRVARSKNPDGPYFDPQGNDMADLINVDGSNWANAEPYGAKMIGNFAFVESKLGYLSPGHNSAYYDEETGKMYVIFHTRYPGQGGIHQVRVHQMLINSKGWPVITPQSYKGETVAKYSKEEVTGIYQYVNHGHDIQATFGNPGGDINLSENIKLAADGTISGAVAGTWQLTGDYTVDLTIDGATYHGVFLKQWDRGLKKNVMTFSALSNEGISIWGTEAVGDISSEDETAKNDVSEDINVDIEGGLIAHYTFNESLEDTIGSFAAGNVVGNTIDAKGSGTITYSDGVIDHAAVFDGKSGIRLPDGLITDNSYSVSLWLNPKEIKQYVTTFFGAQTQEQWISIVPNGPTGDTMLWSGTKWYDAAAGMQIDTDKWSHVAITVKNGEAKVYINGSQEFSGRGFPKVFSGDDTKFALAVNWWDAPFKGMIDDLRIYDKAISKNTVKELAKGL
jgi:arabinan endo-1,5-alpha-L-arabinosidase